MLTYCLNAKQSGLNKSSFELCAIPPPPPQVSYKQCLLYLLKHNNLKSTFLVLMLVFNFSEVELGHIFGKV